MLVITNRKQTMKTKHNGNLVITDVNAKEFDNLVEVTGYLHIDADAQLPALTTVGGSLEIHSEAQLPALTTVGRSLYVKTGITFDYSAIKFHKGKVIAIWQFALHEKDGMYTAGCRGPWTKEQALAHWGEGHHEPGRAAAFRDAIKKQSCLPVTDEPFNNEARTS